MAGWLRFCSKNVVQEQSLLTRRVNNAAVPVLMSADLLLLALLLRGALRVSLFHAQINILLVLLKSLYHGKSLGSLCWDVAEELAFGVKVGATR